MPFVVVEVAERPPFADVSAEAEIVVVEIPAEAVIRPEAEI